MVRKRKPKRSKQVKRSLDALFGKSMKVKKKKVQRSGTQKRLDRLFGKK